MAFKFTRGGPPKQASKIVRVTSLFQLKPPKTGSVGGVQGEYFDKFVKVVEEAIERGTGLTFFYNTWGPGEPASLSVAVAEPYTPKPKSGYQGGGYRARVEQGEEQRHEEQTEGA